MAQIKIDKNLQTFETTKLKYIYFLIFNFKNKNTLGSRDSRYASKVVVSTHLLIKHPIKTLKWSIKL